MSRRKPRSASGEPSAWDLSLDGDIDSGGQGRARVYVYKQGLVLELGSFESAP